MSDADKSSPPEVEPESEPPTAHPEIREALDRMEEERQLPDADEAADRDDDAVDDSGGAADDDITDDDADGGDEAPSG
jgi:hypothetical protein